MKHFFESTSILDNKLRVTDTFSTDKHQILFLDSFIISIPKTQKIILDHCFQYAVTCDLLCKGHIGVGHKIYTKYYELSGGRILYSLSIVVSPIVGLCRKFKSAHVVCVRAYSFFIDIFSSKIFCSIAFQRQDHNSKCNTVNANNIMLFYRM